MHSRRRGRRFAWFILLLGGVVAAQTPKFSTQSVRLVVDFDDLEGWRSLWTSPSGRWELAEDPTSAWGSRVLTQRSTFLDYPKIYIQDSQFYDYQSGVSLKILPLKHEPQPLPGSATYEIPPDKQAEIAHPRDYAGGLLLRYRGPFIFIALMADARRKEVVLVRMDLNGPRILEHHPVDLKLNEWHRLSARCDLDVIRVSWDGRPLFDRREKWLTGGRAGLITAGSSRVYFDHFAIQAEQLQPVRPGSGETKEPPGDDGRAPTDGRIIRRSSVGKAAGFSPRLLEPQAP